MRLPERTTAGGVDSVNRVIFRRDQDVATDVQRLGIDGPVQAGSRPTWLNVSERAASSAHTCTVGGMVIRRLIVVGGRDRAGTSHQHERQDYTRGQQAANYRLHGEVPLSYPTAQMGPAE